MLVPEKTKLDGFFCCFFFSKLTTLDMFHHNQYYVGPIYRNFQKQSPSVSSMHCLKIYDELKLVKSLPMRRDKTN